MKKMAIVFGVILTSNVSNAFYGSQLIQREYDQDPSQISFLDAADNLKDEYGYQQTNQTDEYQVIQQGNQTAIDEYDQHVCDEAQPEKVSAAQALLKEMFGFVLIQYMTIKEITHAYYAEIKQAVNKWFTTLIKA